MRAAAADKNPVGIQLPNHFSVGPCVEADVNVELTELKLHSFNEPCQLLFVDVFICDIQGAAEFALCLQQSDCKAAL